MNIEYNNESALLAGQAVTFHLQDGESAHVLHPGQIVAFRGASSLRSDKLMDMKGMYRKRKLIRADIQGPCQFVASLPPSVTMKPIALTAGSDLLYDFKHLFFYTEGVQMETRILSMKNMMITRDAIKMKFSGEGLIGILTQGQVLELPLDPVEPVYVEAGSVIAYPENAKLELSVYGNHLASQHMRYQWKMTGRGHVLIQAGSGNRELERDLQNEDGIVKRFLREAIPFGGVFIK
ncbi:AIM24 family protein [Paenibacillus ihumii]|uniref:AIM24 family protein n=1 Tax=Paenibacillus ihumii TaxID=687436 RepID=UPI0006D7D5D3|nr:AIM24 family protein [Paenibacillus ihumii]